MKQSVLTFLHRLSRIGASAVAVMGGVVLSGWILGIPSLKTVLPGLVSMKVNTACGFLAIGIALRLRCAAEPGPLRRRLSIALAAGVAAIGSLTFFEYIFSINLGIDELILPDDLSPMGIAQRGRMAPATALAFISISLALLLLDVKILRRWHVSQGFALGVMLIAMLGLVGYAYGVDSLYRVGPYTPMAIHTAATFLLSSLVILGMRPKRGFMEIVTSETAGGIMARRLALLIPAVLFVLGWVCLRGEAAEYYDFRFGLALMAILSMVAATLLVAWQARTLHSIEMASRDLRKAAGTDPMTGLNNRRTMMEHLDRDLRRAVRERLPVSIVMIDVDRFKTYNDAFGHPAGDELLKRLADLLRESARGADYPARYGGEEFMIILPETGRSGSMIYAERLRERIESNTWDHRRVTVSIGISTFDPESEESVDSSRLIHEADRALYASKKRGRNRVTHSTDSDEV